ncbi:MAG: hypothetical protein RR085_12620, partial [Clostridia bacterium]
QSIAMFTAMTEINQDDSETGNAAKVLAMRLRGAKVEVEAMGESTDGMAVSTSKLREKVLALTNVTGKGGFDLMKDDGSFKSTYEQMDGIAKVWKDMKGINKDALLELIAGKNRGSAVGGMLNNWETAQKALEVSTKSAGSAYKEQDKWMQSIEAKQKKMTASFQAFSTSAVSSEIVGLGFDAGSTIFSGLQSITDLLGSIPTLAAAAAAAISIVFKKGISFVKYAPYRRNCAMA